MESIDVPAAEAAPVRPHPSPWRAVALIAGWLALSVVARVAIESATVLVVLALGFAGGHDAQALLTDPELLTSHMTAGLVGAASLAQIVALTALAALFARLLAPDLGAVFALRRPALPALALGLVGGLVVGFFPGWLAQTISEHVPVLDWGNLELMNEMLGSATWVGKGVMLLAIAVAAPICEELIFRGFLWTAADRVLPRVGTWLLTSALFALYHVDPVHVIAVFFTGLFLGWIRWTTGSIWPAIAAHFANNSLAATVVLLLPAAEETSNAGWAAAIGVAATLAFSAALFAVRTPHDGDPDGRAPRA